MLRRLTATLWLIQSAAEMAVDLKRLRREVKSEPISGW